MLTFRHLTRTVLPPALLLLIITPVFLMAARGETAASDAPAYPRNEFVPRFVTLRPNPAEGMVQAEADAVSGPALPTWRGWFRYNGEDYVFTMLGSKIAQNPGTTNIDTIIIPLRLTFADGTVLDATNNVCDGQQSALTLTETSPLFQSMTWMPGGTNVGTTQYVDAFQRANFWNRVHQSAYAEYHTLLNVVQVMPVQTIDVSAENGSTVSGPCTPIGEVNYTYFDTQINSLILSLGIQPDTLALFLDYNTFETENGGCCILGYHGVRGANQVYGVAAYSDPGIFQDSPGIQDIHALSHEIGEIYDDPYAGNNTPFWQSQYAPQYGCNNFLEAGDPLVGSAIPVTLNGFTYHPQELVFKSWFAKRVPSSAVNGWYSFSNTLTSPSPVC